MRRPCLLLLATVLTAVPLRAADDVCDMKEAAPRLVAIGDVHGAYAQFVAVLRFAQLVDDKEHWSGGRTTFVQTGDLLDRGSDTRQVLELMMRLEGEAKKAGGKVVALLGNHEAMNLLGDLRYVSREEYKAYADKGSNDARESSVDCSASPIWSWRSSRCCPAWSRSPHGPEVDSSTTI